MQNINSTLAGMERRNMNPKSPCCNIEMGHQPDTIHFHFYCPKCGNEFELDGETERITCQ